MALNMSPNMANLSAQSHTIFLDIEADLQPLLDSIISLPVNPPSLYLGLEEIGQDHDGSHSILSLHIAPNKKTYLIDIHSFGTVAFSTTDCSGTSLRTILESSTIPKVVFDLRNISRTLFGLFRISVDGIKDLQLMELAYRTGSREFVSSLANCVEKERSTSAVENGERHKVFTKRSLKSDIAEYCKQNVVLLPALFDVYNTKLRLPEGTFWRIRVRNTTRDRIKLSQSSGYDEKLQFNVLGWNDQAIEEEIESWNDDIMMEALAGENILNENDEWVLAPTNDLDFLFDEEEEQEENADWDDDTARDCIGWEDDMIKNGEF